MTHNNTTNSTPFIYLPLYLSDYVSEARKLTMLQRGSYIDLACLYFQENLKLGYTKEQIYRMVFAFEQQEKDAVDFVLENYFVKSENKPMGFYWVSNQLNSIADKVLKRLNASRNNGKKGGRGNKKEDKPIGSDLLNLEKSILNESKLNEIKLNKIKLNEAKLNETEIYDVYDELGDGLKFILETNLNRTIKSTKGWKNEIKKLIEIDLKPRNNALEDVKKAIQAIADHSDNQYFPVIQSASSLREKFAKIEAYLIRNKPPQTNSSDTFNNLMEKYGNE